MGLAARAWPSAADHDEPLIELSVSELLGSGAGGWDDGEGLDDPDEPWCVDLGVRLECMSAIQIWKALGAGRIDSTTKVWRDGCSHWLPIAAVPELAEAGGSEEHDGATTAGGSIPERSEIRRRQPSAPEPQAVLSGPPPAPAATALAWLTRWLRPANATRLGRMLRLAPVLGLLSGLVVGTAWLVWPPAERTEVPGLRRVAVDVAARSRLHAERARETVLRRERAWWRARWR
jgi:hypothetical protein